MSRQFSTTDSEISDLGDDMQDILLKNNKLNHEIDRIKKESEEKEHNLNYQLNELLIENEKFKALIKNQDDLIKTYKTDKPIPLLGNLDDNNAFENKIIIQLENKVSELENQVFHLKQSEQELIRQNQAHKREISDLNLDIDKLKISSNKKDGKSVISLMNEGCELIDWDNLDDEKKQIIQEIIKEYEEVKKENQELKENAINTLTEKELVNMDLREQLEELKNRFNNERKKYVEEIHKYKTQLNDIEIDRSYFDGEEIEFTKEETKELIDKYHKLEEDYTMLKQEMEEKEFNHENEKIKTEKELERTIYNYKSTIFNLEQEISRYQQELTSYQMDKAELERAKEQDYENNNLLVTELEKYQSKIRLIEESKEKIEQKFKDNISFLNMQFSESDRQNTILKNNKAETEKELIELKLSFNNKIKEEKEKIKADLILKDKEIFSLKEEQITMEKEFTITKQNNDLLKKNYEKLKIEYNLIHEHMKKLKEIHENEIKKLEDRYIILERKYEQQLINNDGNVILRSNSLLCQTLPNIGSALTSKPRATNVNSKINQVNNTKSLMDALESAADESSPQSQIIFLQNEVVMLKDQITDLNLKIYKFQNQQEDHDFLLKENKKLKSDIKDMESLYEKQIADLNKKTVDMNAEIEMANKQRLSVNKRHSVTNNKKSLSNYNENSETMKLKAEINFLQEKVQILTKEMENIKNLYENDIKYLKEQLRSSESIAVSAKISLATLAYEKDSEIIKYKNSLRKLKTRLNGMSNESDNSSNQNSILTGTFLKNFFK